MGTLWGVQGVEQGEVCAYIIWTGVKYVNTLFWCCIYTHPATQCRWLSNQRSYKRYGGIEKMTI